MSSDHATTASLDGLSVDEKRKLLAELMRAKQQAKPWKEAPLSLGQERMWFLQQLQPDNSAYNIPLGLELKGEVDQAALERAFASLARRHEVLRTTFHEGPDAPLQRIHAAVEIPIEVHDLRRRTREASREAARRLARARLARTMDLGLRPGWHVILARCPDVTQIHLVVHHIVFDDWSGRVFLRELRALYDAHRQGREPDLPELPIQFADYARWQRRRMQGEHLDRLLDYWRGHLADNAPLALPADRPRPAVQTFRGAQHVVELDPTLHARLEDLARRHRVTLFMVLLAAYAVMLHKLSGQSAVTIGSPVAGRDRAETTGLLGFLLNMLAMRVDLRGEPRFAELLQRTRAVVTGAYAHQDIPFETLVQALAEERDLSRNPLFQASFVLLTFRASDFDMEADSVDEQAHNDSSKFDLTLTAMPVQETLAVLLEHNTDLFDEATVQRWLDGYVRLLAAVVDDPRVAVAELPFAGEDERRRLLGAWAGRTREAAPPLVLERVSAAVRAGAERSAIEAPDGRAAYQELDERSDRLARLLVRRGVRVGDRVAVCTGRSVHLPIAELAVLKAGAAFVALDPAYPLQRLAFMLDDSQSRLLLSLRSLADGLPPCETVYLDAPVDPTDLDGPVAAPSLDRAIGAEDMAYVVYTSGSTGRPKGVAVSHAGLANLVAWHIETYAMNAEDRSTLLAGPGFDASVWEIWPTLCAGASLHAPDLGVRASPAALPRWLAERGITLCFVPTPLGEKLLDEAWPDAMALRALLVGGSTLHRHRPAGFAAQLVNHYGPTENSVVATFHEVASAASDGVAPGVAPPIGRPVDGCQAYLLDERGRLAPQGAVGELCLGGDSLAIGYLGQPARTAASFVPDPFASTPGTRLYRTGDLARHRADGAIEFRGRRDAQVKVRGFRIELGEIESVLLESPAVREAVVQTRRQPSGETILVAWVVLSEPVSPTELRGPLGDVLPDYMVPARFLELDELPKTANGKIDRAALAALDDRQDELEVVKVLPRTPLERTVAKVYASVLQVDGFGIDDSFFELGGSSLLLTRAQRRLTDELGRDVPIIELFNHPTIRLLAQHLGDRADAPPDKEPATAPAQRTRDRLRLQRTRRAERG